MQAYDPFAAKAAVAPSPAVAPVWLSAASEGSIRLAPLNLPPDTQRRIQALEKLSSEELGSYGSDTSKRMTALSESVTSRVTLANSGDFGDGIVQILKLTGTVDIKQLGQPSEKGLSGLIRKAKNAVTGVKVEVMAQFNSVSTEIDKICGELRKGVDRMKEESKWLASCYDENLNCLNELECNAEAVAVHLARQQDLLERMKQSNQEAEQIAIQASKVERLERLQDKLIKLVHLAKLTAPEIRLMQDTNYKNAEDFRDLIDTAIPAWKKQISFALIALRQKKDTELSNEIKDKSNDFFKKAADMIHDNSIAAAQNRQRGSIDLATIEHIQNQHLDAVRRVKEIEEQGRQNRKTAAERIKQMDQQLHDEMKKW